MKAPLEISPAVLRWILTQLDAVKDAASRALIQSWLEGSAVPGYADLSFISKVSGIPMGLFGLKNPPTALLPFKLPPGSTGSLSLSRLADEMLLLQDWLINYQLRNALPELAFVGSLPDGSGADLAAALTRTFTLSAGLTARCTDLNDAFLVLRAKVSRAGVCVMLCGFNDPHPLSLQQYKVFTLSDPGAPLIALNCRQSSRELSLSLLTGLSALTRGQSVLFADTISDARCAQSALQLARLMHLEKLPAPPRTQRLPLIEQAGLRLDAEAFAKMKQDVDDGITPRKDVLRRLRLTDSLYDELPQFFAAQKARLRALQR